MGLLKGLFGLVDDIITIPTDMVGLTNHWEKKEILERAKRAYLRGEITIEEYKKIKTYIEY